ncbi:uncharacterized protein LOC119402854 [Rhipicephalus sanguineus]|uniref:uncharacterized protein LOC119402854 n=1 Tax=Rhipicephalus sanguineus TaxID=34632 RepID=UPI001892F21B|nr:uncharacterized protein LOC119402854 [Rhipicephalus sanguineus]
MQAPGANILCFLWILSLLSTLGEGPTCVTADTIGPKNDPLYFYRGNSNGARPPRRRPTLSTIHEEPSEGPPQREDGRAALLRNPLLRGRGAPPITHLRFHPQPVVVQGPNIAQPPPPNPGGGNLLGAINRRLRHLHIRRQG